MLSACEKIFEKELKMPRIEKPDFKVKKGIPVSMKMALLIAVLVGIWSRSCFRTNEVENIVFENIFVENQTHISVEVIFDVNNQTFQNRQKNILIEIFTSQNELIASRITSIDIVSRETRRYVRRVERFERPLKEDEIVYAKVSLYQRKAF